MGIALTKCLAEEDYAELAAPLKIVDTYFEKASPQHHHRRWEYALACEAFNSSSCSPQAHVLDVGGAGSPLSLMFGPPDTTVVDPVLGCSIEDYQGLPGDAVYCISVIEHIEDLESFCAHLARVTSPGGLLFLTMDIWGRDSSEKDTAHFSGMRARIFTLESWKQLASDFHYMGFSLLGDADWDYHGDHLGEPVNDYSFASLALIKEK